LNCLNNLFLDQQLRKKENTLYHNPSMQAWQKLGSRPLGNYHAYVSQATQNIHCIANELSIRVEDRKVEWTDTPF
jgi:hypothetical protein